MENRSLDRGITVMECLARNGSCSLAELHQLTGLAKSTLRRLSPFAITPAPVDRQLNIFGTASGLACLAAMPDAEIAEIHRRTRAEAHWSLARFSQSLEAFMAEVAAARAAGYGTRITGYRGETIVDDGLAAIAVALIRQGRPAGALTLLWPRVFKSIPAFAKEFLPRLQQAADAVAAELARHDGEAPGA